jgi:rod shape determining protein RodA
LEPGPQRVEGLPPLSLPIMAAHYPSVPARWSDRRERHPAWDLVSRCDFILVGSAVLLSLIGAVMVYSATRVELTAVGGDPKFYLKRQLVWLGIGLVVMVVVALIDYHWLEQWAYVIYGFVVMALLAVLTHFGHVSLGAQRWFAVGPLEVQPSEFAALALILVVAVYCSRQETMFPRNLVVVLTLAGVPILLVYKQPDLGTALIMSVVLMVMIVTSGARLRYLVVLALAAIAGLAAAIHFKLIHAYELQRFTSFLHQNTATSGANWNLAQSILAIASGGAFGTGVFHGAATNGGFVPAQQTDFIFTAVGEQLGFAGGVLVIALFGVIAFRLLRAAQIARDPLGRMLCSGALALLAFSVFQNVGMTIGLIPIAGIPLPFVSYGGSAMIVFFATVGLVVNVEMRRSARR